MRPLHRLTHMVTCKDASRLLSQAQDRRLTLVERLKLRVHLAVCDACTRFSVQLTVMRRAMRQFRS